LRMTAASSPAVISRSSTAITLVRGVERVMIRERLPVLPNLKPHFASNDIHVRTRSGRCHGRLGIEQILCFERHLRTFSPALIPERHSRLLMQSEGPNDVANICMIDHIPSISI
jgi:hypothetical protein